MADNLKQSLCNRLNDFLKHKKKLKEDPMVIVEHKALICFGFSSSTVSYFNHTHFEQFDFEKNERIVNNVLPLSIQSKDINTFNLNKNDSLALIGFFDGSWMLYNIKENNFRKIEILENFKFGDNSYFNDELVYSILEDDDEDSEGTHSLNFLNLKNFEKKYFYKFEDETIKGHLNLLERVNMISFLTQDMRVLLF